MESSVPPGKSQTEPPRNRWGEFWGSAIAILTLILPVVAIVHYSPTSQVQALPNLPSTARPEWVKDSFGGDRPDIQRPIPSKIKLKGRLISSTL